MEAFCTKDVSKLCFPVSYFKRNWQEFQNKKNVVIMILEILHVQILRRTVLKAN